MPSGFPGVRGHASVVGRLQRAIERDQLHHGLVFVGPRGVGKAQVARGLACALHCETARGRPRGRPRGRGCGECSACLRVLGGTHTGVEWVRPEEARGTIKVADARQLANRLEHAPFEGDAHVVIFDPATALTEQAFNALLKAIEEPRPGVHFVMITTQLDGLLPTILSRCLAVRFGRLEQAEVEAILERCEEEITPERAALAARLADGSAGLAVELATDPTLEGALTLLGRAIEASRKGAAKIFGGDKSPLWTAWNDALGTARTGRPARERALCARTAELWILHLREQLRGGAGLPGLPDEPPPESAKLLGDLGHVQALLEGLDRNPNVRLAFEQTLLEVS